MKILFLYNNQCAIKIYDWLMGLGHDCILWNEHLNPIWCKDNQFDLTISYTYQYIIKPDVIEALGNNIVNLHTSFLPWNKGCSPNIWSIVEKTPRGVSLHFIDKEIDEGYLIMQKLDTKTDFSIDTFRTSYDKLDELAFELFKEAFMYYKYWNDMRKKIVSKGTYHTEKESNRLIEKIGDYDMVIADYLGEY